MSAMLERVTDPGTYQSFQLAFTRVSVDMDIYRLEVGHRVQRLVGSTFEDIEPRLSQDGRRLVFGLRRSGDTVDIWMADADGSRAAVSQPRSFDLVRYPAVRVYGFFRERLWRYATR